MPAKKSSGSGRKRENVPVPNKKELHDASGEMRSKHPSGGRVMAEKSAWNRRYGKKKP